MTRRALPAFLPLLPLSGALVACGPTEVLVGDAPGVARVVAGVLAVPYQVSFPDTAPTGRAASVPLGLPRGLAALDDGSFYFADALRRRVGYVAADGAGRWPIGRGQCGTPGPGGPPDQLCLVAPSGVAVAPDGAVLVTDPGNHRVYRVDLAAGAVSVLLGTGTPGVAADGAVAATAATDTPEEIAVGPDGSAYVTERRNHRVVRIDPAGLLRVVAGTGAAGDAGDGGLARDAQFRRPAGLAWVGAALFVADAGNHRIRVIVRDTVRTFAGIGAAGFAGDRGPARGALLREPGRLVAAGALLFVADRGNHRVRIIQVGPDSIDTYGGTGATTPGPDLLAIGRTALVGPAGLASAGRALFVSDSGGYVIRRVVR